MHQFGAGADHPAQSVAAATYGLVIAGPSPFAVPRLRTTVVRTATTKTAGWPPGGAAAGSLAPPPRKSGRLWRPALTPRAPFWLFEAAHAHSFVSNKTVGDRQADANLAVSGWLIRW
jgi:hypothetical protein